MEALELDSALGKMNCDIAAVLFDAGLPIEKIIEQRANAMIGA